MSVLSGLVALRETMLGPRRNEAGTRPFALHAARRLPQWMQDRYSGRGLARHPTEGPEASIGQESIIVHSLTASALTLRESAPPACDRSRSAPSSNWD